MLTFNPQEFSGSCFAFMGRDVVVRDDGRAMTFHDLQVLKEHLPADPPVVEKEYDYCALGIVSNREEADNIPQGYHKEEMRFVAAGKEEGEVICLSRAKAVVEWLRRTRFCGCCGGELKAHCELTAMVCPRCGNLIFPRIEPCIIVLVHKDDKVLLARHANRNARFYACLAGFMEAGETAEEAVRREVKEETNLAVKNIKYFGSQSWPYPSQLMIAFTAEYDYGEMHLQQSEIADAQWFAADELPQTPPKGSIAYRLIDCFVNEQNATRRA